MSLTVSIGDLGQIQRRIAEASAYHEAVRADARRSSIRALDWTRALIRATVADVDRRLAAETGKRCDAARRVDVEAELARGLGLVAGESRVDASYYAGELIDRTGGIVRAPDEDRAVVSSLPTRSVSPGAAVYETRGLGYQGVAGVWKGNSTEIPAADYAANSAFAPLHAFVCKTSIDWRAAMHGTASDIDQVAEKGEAARRALLSFHEQSMIRGVAGLDLRGLAQAQVSKPRSALDYAAGATTLGDIFEDLSGLIAKYETDSGDRGPRPNAILMASDWLRVIRAKNSYDAGGSSSGAAVIRELLAQLGVDVIIPAPSLNGFDPLAPAAPSATFSSAVAFHTSNPDTLQQVVALAPTVVRSAQSLTGDEQLWAMISGGCDAPESRGAFILSAKVK